MGLAQVDHDELACGQALFKLAEDLVSASAEGDEVPFRLVKEAAGSTGGLKAFVLLAAHFDLAENSHN